MQRRARVLAASSAAVVVLGVTGVAIAGAAGDEQPLNGDASDRAMMAALEAAGGGEVIESEVGDGGAAYEVEVRLDDGQVVEIHLDERFEVTGSSADDDPSGEDDDGADADD